MGNNILEAIKRIMYSMGGSQPQAKEPDDEKTDENPNILQGLIQMFPKIASIIAPEVISPVPTGPSPTPMPTPTPTPSMTVDKYMQDQAHGADLNSYYPAYPMVSTKSAEMETQYEKPGLADLMKLVGFFESTMGRHVGKPYNYWGMAPTSDKFQGYGSDIEAADRWGQAMSGQRYNFYPILSNPGAPITAEDIDRMYSNYEGHSNYNPERVYADKLKDIWTKLGYE